MKEFSTVLSPTLINSRLKCKSRFLKEIELKNVAEISEADQNSVCFYENSKYLDQLQSCQAGLILVPEDLDPQIKPDTNLIFVKKPYFIFMLLVKQWLEMDSVKKPGLVSDRSVISPSAQMGKNISIGNFTVIGKDSVIGENTVIGDNSVISRNVSIGKNCRIFPNVTVYEDCVIGNGVIIHSGTVIGSDGFGYILHEGKQEKIPQVGNVIIHDNVEIGSNTSIDRATIGSTVIGNGTKIDNLVQIGHNCTIGENSILCAQVGLAGSTVVGDHVYLAGQVGVAGHLKINNGAMIGAQSGVSGSVPENAIYFGSPAIDAKLKKRIIASEKRIPEVVKFVKKQIKKME